MVRERLIIARGRREGKEDEQRLKEGEGGGKILGVNLGKNKESPSPVGDYVKVTNQNTVQLPWSSNCDRICKGDCFVNVGLEVDYKTCPFLLWRGGGWEK